MNGALAERLEDVRKRIREACARSGRDPDEVNILPVTKKVDPALIREAFDCGLSVFGESRVQEARQKISMCPSGIEWHMVGHLQQNKVRVAAELFSAIHSADSMSLLESLDASCGHSGRSMRVFIEVNVSGESSKFGLPPPDLPSVLEGCSKLMRLEVVGLMTIPPLADAAEKARPYFAVLRELRDRTALETGVPLRELSMGMSNDFEVAVEEGATWVRLGAALFGSRKETQR